MDSRTVRPDDLSVGGPVGGAAPMPGYRHAAIRELAEQVVIIRADINDINRRVDQLSTRVVQAENRARMRELIEHHVEVQALALRMGRAPDLDN